MLGSRISIAFLTAVACMASGCSLSMGNLLVASTKNVPIQQTVIKRNVEGRDCTYVVLLLIPIGSLTPSFQEAADRALATAPEANALSNVAIYSEPLILLLYNRSCLLVRGDAVKIEALPAVQPPAQPEVQPSRQPEVQP